MTAVPSIVSKSEIDCGPLRYSPQCLRRLAHFGLAVRAEDFKDGEDVECEITQIIGDIESYQDLSASEVLL